MSKIILTKTRNQINDLDTLPIYDRSLVDYSKYNKNIGHAGVKYSMAVQATRGCPYRCFYCDVYKTTLHHFPHVPSSPDPPLTPSARGKG